MKIEYTLSLYISCLYQYFLLSLNYLLHWTQRQIAQGIKFGQKPPSRKSEGDEGSSDEEEVPGSPLKVMAQVETEPADVETKVYICYSSVCCAVTSMYVNAMTMHCSHSPAVAMSMSILVACSSQLWL